MRGSRGYHDNRTGARALLPSRLRYHLLDCQLCGVIRPERVDVEASGNAVGLSLQKWLVRAYPRSRNSNRRFRSCQLLAKLVLRTIHLFVQSPLRYLRVYFGVCRSPSRPTCSIIFSGVPKIRDILARTGSIRPSHISSEAGSSAHGAHWRHQE